jgi:hypothetical protein
VARGKYSGGRYGDYDLIDVTGAAPGVVFDDAPRPGTGKDEADGSDHPAAGEADESAGAASPPYNPTASLRAFLYRIVAPPDHKPPRPARPARQGPATTRKPAAELVSGLDSREKIISLVAAALAFAFAVSVLVIYPHPPAHPAKGTVYIEPWVVALIVGIPAIGMGVGVAIARRALVGFLSVLLGFATLTVVGIYGLLYFGLGIWLIMRASRYSKQVREASGEKLPAGRSRPARGDSGGGRTSTRAAGKSSARPSSKTAVTSAPPAKSKRYTPPRTSTTSSRRRTPSS